MSEPDVRIESKRVKLLRGPLGGQLGEVAIVLAMFILAIAVNGWFARFVGHSLGGAGVVGIFGVPLFTLLGLGQRRNISEGAGSIGVVGDDLVIVQDRERKQIPLADLVEGRSSPRRGEVDLGMRGGKRIVAQVERAADAERLLVAAGLDASKRTMRFELGETTFLTWMTFLLGPVLVLPLTRSLVTLAPMPWFVGVIVFVALFALLLRLVYAAWGPAKLIVGADGIIVDRALRDVFVPYARLASIQMKHDAVTMTLTDGSRVRARARHLDDVQQGELRARLDAAKAAFDRGESDAESLSRLDRGGRTVSAWREALRALLDKQGSYRETPLTREQLLAVLESPAAPAERRLAAAVSLSAAGEAQIAARIRIAAEACARQKVRIALEGVADGDVDDAAIEAAIAEEEAPRAQR